MSLNHPTLRTDESAYRDEGLKKQRARNAKNKTAWLLCCYFLSPGKQKGEEKERERRGEKKKSVAKPTLSQFDIPFRSSKLLPRISPFKSHAVGCSTFFLPFISNPRNALYIYLSFFLILATSSPICLCFARTCNLISLDHGSPLKFQAQLLLYHCHSLSLSPSLSFSLDKEQ